MPTNTQSYCTAIPSLHLYLLHTYLAQWGYDCSHSSHTQCRVSKQTGYTVLVDSGHSHSLTSPPTNCLLCSMISAHIHARTHTHTHAHTDTHTHTQVHTYLELPEVPASPNKQAESQKQYHREIDVDKVQGSLLPLVSVVKKSGWVGGTVRESVCGGDGTVRECVGGEMEQ